MPTTLTALLILLFAIVPGMFGEMVYRIIAGTDWRETQWSKVARIIGISIAGLVLYIVLASLTGLPTPQYLFPVARQPPLRQHERPGKQPVDRSILRKPAPFSGRAAFAQRA